MQIGFLCDAYLSQVDFCLNTEKKGLVQLLCARNGVHAPECYAYAALNARRGFCLCGLMDYGRYKEDCNPCKIESHGGYPDYQTALTVLIPYFHSEP